MKWLAAATVSALLIAVAIGCASSDSGASSCPGVRCSPYAAESCPPGQGCTTGMLHGPCGSYAICVPTSPSTAKHDGEPCDPDATECVIGSSCPCATRVCTPGGIAPDAPCAAQSECAHPRLCRGSDALHEIVRGCVPDAGTCYTWR